MSKLSIWFRLMIYRYRVRKRFPKCIFHQRVTVDQRSFLGDNTVLFRDVYMQSSVLGAYSYVQSGSSINNSTIGPFCSIARNVTIGLAAHPMTMVSTNPVFYDNQQPLPRFFTQGQAYSQGLPETFIGADVWVGQGVMVKAGVKIGVGAVIGAGSIVTKDIPAYSIAVGNPCRPIKKRFPEEICIRLLASEWWKLSESELEELAPTFIEPDLFLATVEKKGRHS
jgi:acetyltransferase-like isoleucine patch superfamily enzyme